MAKALVITEKPSVARDITQVFGGFTEHDGYFENDAHVVTFAVGHLYELLPPEEVAYCVVAVSACSIWIFSTCTPSSSATIIAAQVLVPVPMSEAPMLRLTLPSE